MAVCAPSVRTWPEPTTSGISRVTSKYRLFLRGDYGANHVEPRSAFGGATTYGRDLWWSGLRLRSCGNLCVAGCARGGARAKHATLRQDRRWSAALARQAAAARVRAHRRKPVAAGCVVRARRDVGPRLATEG